MVIVKVNIYNFTSDFIIFMFNTISILELDDSFSWIPQWDHTFSFGLQNQHVDERYVNTTFIIAPMSL